MSRNDLKKMFCRIAAAVLFERDDVKRLVIPKHGENNVTDLVHDRANSNILFPTGTFANVIIVNKGLNPASTYGLYPR